MRHTCTTWPQQTLNVVFRSYAADLNCQARKRISDNLPSLPFGPKFPLGGRACSSGRRSGAPPDGMSFWRASELDCDVRELKPRYGPRENATLLLQRLKTRGPPVFGKKLRCYLITCSEFLGSLPASEVQTARETSSCLRRPLRLKTDGSIEGRRADSKAISA